MRIKLLKHTIVCMAVLILLLGAGCNSADKTSSSKRSKTKNAKIGTGSSKTASGQLSEEQEGFFPLVLNEAFEMYPPGGKPPAGPAWTVEGDTIKCSGEPRGYIYTVEPHRNFTLRFDVRYPPAQSPDAENKMNTGVLVYIPVDGAHKVWPPSLEVQGKQAEMGKVKSNGGAPDVEITDDEQARHQALHSPGEWNSVEVVSNEGALTVSLNGVLVCKSKPGQLKEGRIGFQSEGGEVHFRKIRMVER